MTVKANNDQDEDAIYCFTEKQIIELEYKITRLENRNEFLEGKVQDLDLILSSKDKLLNELNLLVSIKHNQIQEEISLQKDLEHIFQEKYLLQGKKIESLENINSHLTKQANMKWLDKAKYLLIGFGAANLII